MTAWPALQRRTVELAVLGTLGVLSLTACAGPQPRAVGQHLLGKTQEQLVTCAGRPQSVSEAAGLTILTYYKESSVLEEDFPQSKSSFPKIHHGCWARLGLKDDQVVGVEYQTVPPSYEDDHHCEEIFQSCR